MVQNIVLGRHEVTLLSALEREHRRFFGPDRAAAILADASRPVVRNTLSRLVRKGRLRRVQRGSYQLVPFREAATHEFAVVPLVAREGYVSFWSALRFWGLTPQLPRTVAVAVRKPRRRRRFEGTSYRFVTLAARYFFGYERVELTGQEVKVASREKAILDCLLHPEHCGGIGEPIGALVRGGEELDWERMAAWLERMDNSALTRRLAYALHQLGMERQLRRLGVSEFKGYRWLDPSGSREATCCDCRFGLWLNVDLAEVVA